MTKILWIDDNETITDLVGERLERAGHDVTVIRGYRAGAVVPSSFELIILDLYLESFDRGASRPSVTSGLEYLERMLGEDAILPAQIDDGRTKILVLSQHLADGDVRASIRDFNERHNVKAQIRSKVTTSDAASVLSESIAETIESVAVGGPAPALVDEVRNQFTTGSGSLFFEIGIDEYRDLEDFRRAAIQDLAYEVVENSARRSFETIGARWLAYCGDPSQPRVTGVTDPPSAEERAEMADRLGHPVLVVKRSSMRGDIEETTAEDDAEPGLRRRVWDRVVTGVRSRNPFSARGAQQDSEPPGCGGSMEHYPTVTLMYGARARQYHFDSGALLTYVRASHLREGGVILDPEFRDREHSDRGYFYTYPLPGDTECVLVDQVTGGHISVKLKGVAIEQYGNWQHARLCEEYGCLWGRDADLCGVRSGLIGRAFLTDNDLSILISGSTSQTHVKELK